jgi:hypothetical protein
MAERVCARNIAVRPDQHRAVLADCERPSKRFGLDRSRSIIYADAHERQRDPELAEGLDGIAARRAR